MAQSAAVTKMDSGKKTRLDFNVWQGVSYVIDPNLPADSFHLNPLTRTFHIGAGTDLHLRLFWIKLTTDDRAFLKGCRIDPDR